MNTLKSCFPAIVLASLTVSSGAVLAHTSKQHVAPTVLTDSNSKIDSNAYNFKSEASTSVNPQTGQLSTSISLGHLSAHGLGQDFTLNAMYQQGNTANPDDIGAGWALSLPVYNPQTNELTTTNGANYKASTALTPSGKPASCVYTNIPKGANLPNDPSDCALQQLQYHTLKDVILQTYKDASGVFTGAQIIYPDGHRQIINAKGQLAQLVYPKGFSVTLTYSNPNNINVPSTISDNFGDSITTNASITAFTSEVAGQSHVVNLTGGPGTLNLTQIQESDGSGHTYTTQFAYNDNSLGSNLLTKIISPSLAETDITYNQDNTTVANGLPVMENSITQYMPVVTEMVTKPAPNTAPLKVTEQPSTIHYYYYNRDKSLQRPSLTDFYDYSGYPNLASSTQDMMYTDPSNYTYATTEEISQGQQSSSVVTRIIRTYDHHHLLESKKVEYVNPNTGGQPIQVSKQSYSYCPTVQPTSNGIYTGNTCFSGETPEQMDPSALSGLPNSIQTLTYNGTGNASHTSQNLTSYDAYGNTRQKIDCSDTDISAGKCVFDATSHPSADPNSPFTYTSEASNSVDDSSTYQPPSTSGQLTDAVEYQTVTTPYNGSQQIHNDLTTISNSANNLQYQEPKTVITSFAADGKTFNGLTEKDNTWNGGYLTATTLKYLSTDPMEKNYLTGTQHLQTISQAATHQTDNTAHTYTVVNESVPNPSDSKNHLGDTTPLKTTQVYDSASGKLMSETDQAGHETTYTYDALGRLTKKVQFANSKNPLTTSYQYNPPSGGEETMIETLPSASASAPYQKKTVFDSLGQPIAQYDNMGADGKINPGSVNDAGYWTKISSTQYGPNGKTLSSTTYDNNGKGNTTYNYYDYAGNKIATLYPNGTFNVTIDNAPDQLSMSYMAAPKATKGPKMNGFKVVQKVPYQPKLFAAEGAKNPSDMVLNTYLMPAQSDGKNIAGNPVYPSALQGTLTSNENTIYQALGTLGSQTGSTAQGYAMDASSLINADAALEGTINTALNDKAYYSLSNKVYDGFTDEISDTDTEKHVTTMTYNGLGQMTKKTNPAGQSTNTVYNIIGKPVCLSLTTGNAADPCINALKQQPTKSKGLSAINLNVFSILWVD